jgi:hypothetical protein
MGTLEILVFNWCCWFNPAMGGAEVFTCEVAKSWSLVWSFITRNSEQSMVLPKGSVIERKSIA